MSEILEKEIKGDVSRHKKILILNQSVFKLLEENSTCKFTTGRKIQDSKSVQAIPDTMDEFTDAQDNFDLLTEAQSDESQMKNKKSFTPVICRKLNKGSGERMLLL